MRVGKEADLLRMLEPVVRPVGSPVRAPSLPIESESFESLLERARAMNAAAPESAQAPADPGEDEVQGPARPGCLDRLGALDHVANGSLRALLAGGGPNVGAA